MKAEIAAKRKLEKLKAAGAEFSEEEEELLLENFMKEKAAKKYAEDEKSREAESVLALIARQEWFTAKTCRQCELPFATNYRDVAYCSVPCRKLALEKHGITWNPSRDPELRWGYNGERYHDDEGKEHNKPYPAPLVVPPEALKVLVRNPAIRRFFKEAMLEIKPEELEIPEPEPQTVIEPVPEPEPQESAEQKLLAALGG